ncbi:hypothetical protein BBW65_00975 [Helicobacter enhydrae]|uniref:Uncharacterized protein n=1 Tax=Helicobacter enhydrae TaxID=222136 RepID=A0A1B1U419_9HELI|nr:efflux RND transporter periplasmic adaptor subunit [Helicobacter enhydrae]ANV97472.1 hypothetical protein BBW65_00975 [Helicobacter enhydrae]
MRRILLCLVVVFGSVGAKPVVVSTQSVKMGSLDSKNTFVGVIKFKEISHIASQSSGVVEKVLFEVGENVKKGMPLVVLSSDLLQKDIQAKEAKLQQANKLKEYQQKEFERYKNLLETDSITLQQYEKLSYEIAVQEFNILSLQAQLEQAKVELSQKTIVAPFDGIIVQEKVNIGEWLKVGDSVCELVDTTQVQVIVDVPSSLLPFLSKGENVPLKIGQKNYTGRIIAIIPKANARSRTFPIVISLANDGRFVDGMAVNAMLRSGGKSEGFLVPRDSIVEYNNRPSVFIVENGRAKVIFVDVLSIQGKVAVVLGQLSVKDRVIYKGQYRLQNGAEVRENKES